MDGVFMSLNEQLVFRAIEDFRAGKASRGETAINLGVCERTVTRRTRKVRERGLEGVKHGNCRRLPHNRTVDEAREFFVEKYRIKYASFNYSHALELIRLHEEPRWKVSYWTFRKWCRQAGLGKVKRRRRAKAYMARDRAANEGLMLQMDGSPHRWNGKEEWCLLAAIDDATSNVPAARFVPSETTWDCMELLEEICLSKGIPWCLLTDCAGWSTGSGKRQHFSQFVRACEELEIKVIGTPSAETKGRIERMNRTFQDRLVPEFALYGIKCMIDGNRYLQQNFLPEWQAKFTVKPASDTTRYKPLPIGTDLRNIFCLKHKRLVNRDHTMSWEGKRYRINPGTFENLWRKEVIVHEYRDGTINVFHAGTKLGFELMRQPMRMWKMPA